MDSQPWQLHRSVSLGGAAIGRLEWSVTGAVLAASCADGRAVLLAEDAAGDWREQGSLTPGATTTE